LRGNEGETRLRMAGGVCMHSRYVLLQIRVGVTSRLRVATRRVRWVGRSVKEWKGVVGKEYVRD
jgi:hypothetical protein